MPTTVTQLNVDIGARLERLERALIVARRKIQGFGKKANAALGEINKTIGRLGTSLVGVFAGVEVTRAIGSFIANSGRMAAELEGIENAFERLNRPSLLSNLRNATKGTVSDLELMRRAVQANNFQIPVENLASLFQFAAKRAQETGESVEFLTNSIVLGIGRKSPLILDNLGISAVRLREELKGAGVELNTVGDIAAAVGRIAQEEMGKAGDITETAAIAAERLSSSVDNLKTAFGSFVNSPGAIGFTNFLNTLVKGAAAAFGGGGTQSIQDEFLSISRQIENIDRQIASDRELGAFSIVGIDSERTQETLNALQAQRVKLQERLNELLKQEPDLLQNIRDSFNVPVAPIFAPIVAARNEIGAIEKINQDIKATQELILRASRAELPTLNAKLENLRQQKSILEFIGTEASRRPGNVDSIQGVGLTQPGLVNTGFGEGFISDSIIRQAEDLKNILRELNNETTLATQKNIAFGGTYDIIGQKLALTEQAINQLIESGISPQSDAVVNLQIEYQRLSQIYDEQQEKIRNAAQASQEFIGIAQAGLNTIFGLLVRSNDELSKFERILSSSVLGVFSAVIAGGNPITGLFQGLLGGIGSFAEGGIAVGRQLAVVGDNPGRREAIIPSEDFGKIGGGGTQEFRIRGNDLVTVLDRQGKLDKRVR